MTKKITIKADREDYCVGLEANVVINDFSGSGTGWFNYEDIKEFCSNLRNLIERKQNNFELIGGNGEKPNFLETFGLRFYSFDDCSNSGGLVGIHVTLAQHLGTDCRPKEIMTVSGELQAINYHIRQFAEDLEGLMNGTITEVILYGDGRL